jgi:hypothetical protein
MVCSSNVVFDETKIPGNSSHYLGHDLLKDMLPNPLTGNPEEFDSATISLDEEKKLGVMKLPMPPGAEKDTTFEPVPPPNAVLTTAHPDQVAKASSQLQSFSDEVKSSEVSTGQARKFMEFDRRAKPTS